MLSLAQRFLTISRRKRWIVGLAVLGFASAVSAIVIPNLFPIIDPTGAVATYNVNGPINENSSNTFFESLGTNGRTCGTCHTADSAFGLSVVDAQARFLLTRGTDPLFAQFDGANCPGTGAPTNPADHSLLLNQGLIRVGLALPSTAQFTIRAIYDPYGCASVTADGVQTISVYRRPLPATNLNFLSAVMWDGRETHQPLTSSATFKANLVADLMQQAIDATTGHAQAVNPPTVAQQTAIVNFELGLSSAQLIHDKAGLLSAFGAKGGPVNLSGQNYYPGINDVLGGDPTGAKFNSTVFTIFDPWASPPVSGPLAQNLKMIAAGETIFNTFPLTIESVRGLNDNSAVGTVPVPPFQGTCSTCHDAPNVGNHSLPLPLDIGTMHDPGQEKDPIVANALTELNVAKLPIFEIDGCPDPFSGAPDVPIYTSDPGKALISGLCSDVNRVKGPILRGLAARAPYFHNGSAPDLVHLVNFYNLRFQMNLTQQEKNELIAFLNSL